MSLEYHLNPRALISQPKIQLSKGGTEFGFHNRGIVSFAVLSGVVASSSGRRLELFTIARDYITDDKSLIP